MASIRTQSQISEGRQLRSAPFLYSAALMVCCSSSSCGFDQSSRLVDGNHAQQQEARKGTREGAFRLRPRGRQASVTRGHSQERQRPFGVAEDRHGLPLLVRAPHLWLRCMGNLLCVGLIL